nr:hypothetical protein [Rhizobium lusitanum]
MTGRLQIGIDGRLHRNTHLINQMRAFCLEYGVALRQGAGLFKLDLPQALEDLSNDLSPAMRKLLADLFADLRQMELKAGSKQWQLGTRQLQLGPFDFLTELRWENGSQISGADTLCNPGQRRAGQALIAYRG